jgi:glycosyltransferase involved in cell wall biosynthesis
MIGYLTSEYPSISHTFIRREIAALRQRGLEVRTFSLHKPPADSPLGERDRRERSETWYLQPAAPRSVLASHLRVIARAPALYLRALALALRARGPGPRGALWSFFYFAEGVILAEALRSAGVRHLHVHFARASADVAQVACFLCGISWSLTLHGTADVEHPTVLTLGDKIRSARFTACASHFVRAQALRTVELASWDRLLVVRCGIELPEHVVEPGNADPVRILCVGRLSPEKGHYGLLRALAQVHGTGARFRLTCIGDGALRTELEECTRELVLGDCVAFVGARSEEDVMAALSQSDVYASASLMEGLPVTLMEAMAHGLPVVAPRVAGIPELVAEEREGLLFAPSDWDALADQLRRLIRDPELRRTLGRAGRARVSAEFSIDSAIEPLWKRFSAT